MKLFRRIAILLLSILFLSVGAFAEGDAGPLQKLIRKSFHPDDSGPGFYIRTRDRVHVEVCGDSCTYFEWKGDSNDETYWRFITLYELSDGPGMDVQRFLTGVNKVDTSHMLEKKFCSLKGAEVSTIKCDWAAYSSSLKIEVGHSRYDEGNRCYARVTSWDPESKSTWKCATMKTNESPFKK